MATPKFKPLTRDQTWKIITEACEKYSGDCAILESAIGALIFGQSVGWHALRLMHSGRTFKRYEEILGIKFREVLPSQTPTSERMQGIRLMNQAGKFWQVVTAGLVSARDAAQADPA
jgi:hypothetical protein